jgi:hypothetical protein
VLCIKSILILLGLGTIIIDECLEPTPSLALLFYINIRPGLRTTAAIRCEASSRGSGRSSVLRTHFALSRLLLRGMQKPRQPWRAAKRRIAAPLSAMAKKRNEGVFTKGFILYYIRSLLKLKTF